MNARSALRTRPIGSLNTGKKKQKSHLSQTPFGFQTVEHDPLFRARLHHAQVDISKGLCEDESSRCGRLLHDRILDRRVVERFTENHLKHIMFDVLIMKLRVSAERRQAGKTHIHSSNLSQQIS